MKQPPRERPIKDERDNEIEVHAKSYALEWMTAATQILTVICLVKGNPAWKGTLSLLFSASPLLFCSSTGNTRKPPSSRWAFSSCFAAWLCCSGSGLPDKFLCCRRALEIPPLPMIE